MSDDKKLIAVVGATGNQGGGVLRALQARSDFRVRALTRNPAKHGGLADEVVEADLNRPETLRPAFDGAYGVFAVTNSWEPGTVDEIGQATAAIRAARGAGVAAFHMVHTPERGGYQRRNVQRTAFHEQGSGRRRRQ